MYSRSAAVTASTWSHPADHDCLVDEGRIEIKVRGHPHILHIAMAGTRPNVIRSFARRDGQRNGRAAAGVRPYRRTAESRRTSGAPRRGRTMTAAPTAKAALRRRARRAMDQAIGDRGIDIAVDLERHTAC